MGVSSVQRMGDATYIKASLGMNRAAERVMVALTHLTRNR